MLGRLGDVYGKERVLVLVLLVFALGGVVGALADSLATVIAARVLLRGSAARSSRSPTASPATRCRQRGSRWRSG